MFLLTVGHVSVWFPFCVYCMSKVETAGHHGAAGGAFRTQKKNTGAGTDSLI